MLECRGPERPDDVDSVGDLRIHIPTDGPGLAAGSRMAPWLESRSECRARQQHPAAHTKLSRRTCESAWEAWRIMPGFVFQ